MDSIKELLDAWAADGYVNPGAVAQAHEAILLLVAQVQLLEQRVADLEAK